MDKTTQNLIWSCLPHEYKKEVKRQYRIAINGNQYFTQCTLEYLFGYHNLTSDAQVEDELLTVSRNKVQEQYALNVNALREGNLTDMQIEIATKVKDTLYYLFGSKCLPDEACNVASSDVAGSKSKPAEPKFNPGDKVLRKYHDYEDEELPYDIFEGYHGKDKQGYICGIESTCWLIRESDLEPYTEPDTSHETPVCESHSGNTSQKEVNVNSNRNLSQETANCDKCPKSVQKKHPGFGHSVVKDEMIDSIIKEGFRKHNRLYIAAMAMQGILSNQQLLKIAIEIYQEETGSPDMYVAVAKAAKAQADALIAEAEKGGPDVRDKS